MSVNRNFAVSPSLRTVTSRAVVLSSVWLLAPLGTAFAAPTPSVREARPTTVITTLRPASEVRLSVATNESTPSIIAPVRFSSSALWRAADSARRQGRPSHTEIPTHLTARTVKQTPATTASSRTASSRGGLHLVAATPRENPVSTATPVATAATPLATALASPPAVPTLAKHDAPLTAPNPTTTTPPFVVQLTPPHVSAPLATPVTPQVVKPPVEPAVIPARQPAALASREADRRLLAQLDADLRRADTNLDRANSRLSEGQRQLNQFENVLQQAMLEAGPDAKGLNPFVRVAERYMGTPYVWGGESARGFDCSGFIIRVMRDLGYRTPPHSAALQFNYGLPIAQQLLKPGDLVFFKNTYKPGISHVGIYLGHRRFIHAAGTGIGTIVSSLDTPKFQAKYAGARRLVPAQ